MSGGERRIELETLALGPVLGSGGEATIFAVGKREAVKLQDRGEPIDGKALLRLIAWRETLPEAERRLVDSSCAWPTARVDEKGKAVGSLMPRIPPRFIQTLNTGLERPREIQYLCQPDHSRALGIEMPSWEGRLALCRRYAEVLAVLEGNGIVFGDISLRNLLWVAGKRSGVYWIDCDGARRAGTAGVRPAVKTPDWDDPTLGNRDPDHASDRYLLALAVFRIVFQDPYVRPRAGDPRLNGNGGLPADLAALLSKGLTGPREERPTAERLAAELRARRSRIATDAGAAAAPPKPQAPATKPRARVPVQLDAFAAVSSASKERRATIPVAGQAPAASPGSNGGEGDAAKSPWAKVDPLAIVVLAVVILVLLVSVCAALW